MESKGYEKSDVSMRSLFLWAGAVLASLVLIVIILNSIFISTKEVEVYNSVLKPESAELRDLRARETEILNSYEIIDEQEGVVQIPIERAMQLLADEAFKEQLENVR